MHDYTKADLPPDERAMLDFCVKLTRSAHEMSADDVEELRRHGFDDGAIHDIVQVAAMFNYYTRLADGLGIDLEPEMPPRGSLD